MQSAVRLYAINENRLDCHLYPRRIRPVQSKLISIARLRSGIRKMWCNVSSINYGYRQYLDKSTIPVKGYLKDPLYYQGLPGAVETIEKDIKFVWNEGSLERSDN